MAERYDAGLLHAAIIKTLNSINFRSILDIGCGTGKVPLRFAAQKEVVSAEIDNSPRMISIASKKIGFINNRSF
jgi:predicted TPR repeat methyltransferase